MNDGNRIGRLVEIHNVLARLTPEQLRAVDEEGLWVKAQIAKGRSPSPEALVGNAPVLMRLLADLGD